MHPFTYIKQEDIIKRWPDTERYIKREPDMQQPIKQQPTPEPTPEPEPKPKPEPLREVLVRQAVFADLPFMIDIISNPRCFSPATPLIDISARRMEEWVVKRRRVFVILLVRKDEKILIGWGLLWPDDVPIGFADDREPITINLERKDGAIVKRLERVRAQGFAGREHTIWLNMPMLNQKVAEFYGPMAVTLVLRFYGLSNEAHWVGTMTETRRRIFANNNFDAGRHKDQMIAYYSFGGKALGCDLCDHFFDFDAASA